MDIKQSLREQRDELLSSIRVYLSIKVMTEDIDGFKDFIKYIHRYTASEVQFLIEKEGFKGDVEAIMEKIEKKVQNSSSSEA